LGNSNGIQPVKPATFVPSSYWGDLAELRVTMEEMGGRTEN